MILLRGGVELSVICAYPPSRDGSLRDKIIFVVFNDLHASLLWHNLDRTHPLTVRHEIDYPGVQELLDLHLDNLSHRIIYPTLRLPRRCARWVYRDAMSTEGRADSLKALSE